MARSDKPGILLINTGSPDAPEVPETRAYLRQFLSDPRVFDVSPALRWFLLNFVILPFRPKRSAHAYSQIWGPEGSPLIANSERFCERLREEIPEAEIQIAMAYGRPSVPYAIDHVLAAGATRIVAVPMFPQYASATVGSVLELTYKTCAEKMNVPPVDVLPPFYDDPAFLDAWAEVVRPQLDTFKPDHVLISYHGLPLRQIYKSDPTGSHCLQSEDCCERYLEGNPDCYRAHCLATTKGLIERLGLSEAAYTVTYQSRLGRDPWLTPATDETVEGLPGLGVRRLAVLSPAFVADCLETLEELGIQAKESFIASGGEDLFLISSLNDNPVWVRAFAEILRKNVCLGGVPVSP